MSISVACGCGKAFRAPETFAGKRVKCPACGAVFRVTSFADLAQDAGVDLSLTQYQPAAPQVPPTPAKIEPTPPTRRSLSVWFERGRRKILVAGVAAVGFSTFVVVFAVVLLLRNWSTAGGNGGSVATPIDPYDQRVLEMEATTRSLAAIGVQPEDYRGPPGSSPKLPATSPIPVSNVDVCLATSTALMSEGNAAIPALVRAVESGRTQIHLGKMTWESGNDFESRQKGRAHNVTTFTPNIVRKIPLAQGQERDVALHVEFRTWAGLTLARMGPAVQEQVQKLADSSSFVAYEEACRILRFWDPSCKLPAASLAAVLDAAKLGLATQESLVQNLTARGPAVVPELARLLNEPSSNAKLVGLASIKQFGPEAKSAFGPVAACFRDRDVGVAGLAIGTAKALKPDSDNFTQALLPILKHEQSTLRNLAFAEVKELPRPKVNLDVWRQSLIDFGVHPHDDQQQVVAELLRPDIELVVPQLLKIARSMPAEPLKFMEKSKAIVLLSWLAPDDAEVTTLGGELLGDDRLFGHGTLILSRASRLPPPAIDAIVQRVASRHRDPFWATQRPDPLVAALMKDAAESRETLQRYCLLLSHADVNRRHVAFQVLSRLGPDAKVVAPDLLELMVKSARTQPTDWLKRYGSGVRTELKANVDSVVPHAYAFRLLYEVVQPDAEAFLPLLEKHLLNPELEQTTAAALFSLASSYGSDGLDVIVRVKSVRDGSGPK